MDDDENTLYNRSISLWIKDTLIYEGAYIVGDKSPYDYFMLIGYTKKDSLDKQYRIKVDTKDTIIMHHQRKGCTELIIRYNLEPKKFSIDTIKFLPD